MSTIISIPLEKVKPGQKVSNDRQDFDPIKIAELAVSIARDGLAQPITVRLADSFYQIVAGERRFRAHLHLYKEGATFTKDGQTITIPPCQITTIDAIVRDLTDEEAAAIMLAENTSRADLNPIEEARAFKSRMDKLKLSAEQIAEMAGVSAELVKRRVDLLRLTDDVQHLVRFGSLPIGHAELLTGLDVNRQRIAIRIFGEAKNGLTQRQFKHIVDDLLTEQQQNALFDLETFWIEQVQKAEMPRRGKRAFTPAPTSRELPLVQRNTRWTAADVIDQYIADLLAGGFKREAAALGNLFTTLIRHNYLAAPITSAIPEPSEEQSIHETTGQNRR